MAYWLPPPTPHHHPNRNLGHAPYVPPTTPYLRQPTDTSASLLPFRTPTLIEQNLAIIGKKTPAAGPAMITPQKYNFKSIKKEKLFPTFRRATLCHLNSTLRPLNGGNPLILGIPTGRISSNENSTLKTT